MQWQSIKLQEGHVPAGFLRRLGAAFYDVLILFAILYFSLIPLVVANGGESVNHPLVMPYLLLVVLYFYGWFWTHGGQTLGMRAWRLKAVQDAGLPLTWRQAILRFIAAFFSWGFLGIGAMVWMFWDRDHYALHDRLSRTLIVLLPKS